MGVVVGHVALGGDLVVCRYLSVWVMLVVGVVVGRVVVVHVQVGVRVIIGAVVGVDVRGAGTRSPGSRRRPQGIRIADDDGSLSVRVRSDSTVVTRAHRVALDEAGVATCVGGDRLHGRSFSTAVERPRKEVSVLLPTVSTPPLPLVLDEQETVSGRRLRWASQPPWQRRATPVSLELVLSVLSAAHLVWVSHRRPC